MHIKSINLKLLLTGLLLVIALCLSAKTIVKWKSIPVSKFKSRRAITFDAKTKIYYYRPIRFEKMPVDVKGLTAVQIRTVSKTKDNEIKFTVYIDGKAKECLAKFKTNDTNYSYFETIELPLPPNTKELSIYTRNPNAYFRTFGKTVKIIKERPKSITLKADSYKRIVNLINSKNRKEYYVADNNNSIRYKTRYNGDIVSWFRFLPLANRSSAKVEIYVNNSLRDTYIFKHKLSGQYKVNGLKVSVGKKVVVKDLKKNDMVEIRVLSNHEVINHSYLKTKK